MNKFLATCALLFVSTAAFGYEKGSLLHEDVTRVNAALSKLLPEDSVSYQIDVEKSGCDFNVCTSVVKRYANFSLRISAADTSFPRKKWISCGVDPGKIIWKCAPGASTIDVPEMFDHSIRISEGIDDATIVRLLKFLRSECFSEQLARLGETKNKPPYWARGKFPVSNIELSKGQYEIDVPFSWLTDAIYTIAPNDQGGSCDFLIIKFAQRVF
ncbi:hypothetical protein [Collimonas pratensis]|uniref:hypothetical protein n=1 Tax=Collimonas pratensis TaxID=279113 RepID=UPI000B046D54|nr:hypothetical protein [Collimonas pratensis]